MNLSTLYLFPNLLADLQTHTDQLPSAVDRAVASIDVLIAESEKGGRRFLRRFTFAEPKTFRDVPIRMLNEHTTPQEKKELLNAIEKGGKWGLISDCGMPCLADPGADLVLMARGKGVRVEAFAGPSSILLALVLSGLGGQHFTFHGYLPKEEKDLVRALKTIEETSDKAHSTHLFIETPYRNQRLFTLLLNVLQPSTWVSIACDLTSETEQVWTLKVAEWKKIALPELNKRPCVFCLKS